MQQKTWIDGSLPGLNEIINEARKNRFASSRQKKRFKGLAYFFKNLQPVKEAHFEFSWIEKDKRRDPDNITAGQKYIFDALVDADIIQNDGWDYVKSIKHDFQSKTDHPPGVLVVIESGE